MLEILIMNLILQEARDAFIEALDDYIKKCQELSTEINQSKDHDNAGSTKMESKDFEKDEEEKDFKQMMNRFTHLLQGFAFQLASTNSI